MVEVHKFGGTCTESPQKISRITKIISESSLPLVVTLSAAAGITNQLKQLLDGKLDETSISIGINRIRRKHIELLDGRFKIPPVIEEDLQRLERLLYGVYYTEELTDRTYDLVMTFGERLISPILELYLRSEEISSTIAYPENFVVTNGQIGSSMVLLDLSEPKIQQRIMPLLGKFQVVIVPGFYGKSSHEIITTLGRSGTDYTGAVLAYGLNAKSLTIWKDVLGFMSADPRIVKSAHTIPYLSYQEAAELAYFGAKLLHPRAASPAMLKHIPIYIRHIDDLDAITCVSSDQSHSDSVIKSVSHLTNLSIVKVFASVGGNTKGVLASIARKIAESGGNTISVATSQTCIAFLMTHIDAHKSISSIRTLGSEMIDNIEINENVSLICVVGEGLGDTPGIASRVFEAVSREQINVDLISAGASRTAYHFTVNENDLETALKLIHADFFEVST